VPLRKGGVVSQSQGESRTPRGPFCVRECHHVLFVIFKHSIESGGLTLRERTLQQRGKPIIRPEEKQRQRPSEDVVQLRGSHLTEKCAVQVFFRTLLYVVVGGVGKALGALCGRLARGEITKETCGRVLYRVTSIIEVELGSSSRLQPYPWVSEMKRAFNLHTVKKVF